MAIRADGRLVVAARYGLAVNALVEGLRDLSVAFAAGGRDVELGDRRLGVVRGADRVRAVAVGADGCLG